MHIRVNNTQLILFLCELKLMFKFKLFFPQKMFHKWRHEFAVPTEAHTMWPIENEIKYIWGGGLKINNTLTQMSSESCNRYCKYVNDLAFSPVTH